MIRHAFLCIPVKHNDPTDLESKCAEVERYFYGRYFRLAVAPPELIAKSPVSRVYWLVEEHYLQNIIDRLASGLFAGRRATPKEVSQLVWLVDPATDVDILADLLRESV